MEKNAREMFFFLTFDPSNSRSEIMKKAFLSIQKRRLKPLWVKFDLLKSTSNSLSLNAAVFIVTDRFEDEIINCFQDKFRIIGPLVITYCDDEYCQNPQSTLPKRTWPLYSQCMRGLEITTSNLSAEKRKLVEKRVRMMSGNYYKNLHGITNVVVSDSVLTKKARVAGQYHIPIVNYEWIEDCWEKYQYDHRKSNDDCILSKYKLPIFHGLNIVSSGLIERDLIKKNVQTNGGKYHPDLKLKPLLPNTILLVNKKQGEKYKHAKRLNIPCLLPTWIDESIKHGYALSFDNFDINKINDIISIDKSEKITTEIVSIPQSSITSDNNSNSNENNDEQNNNLEKILKELMELSNDNDDINNHILDGNSIYAIGFNKNLLTLIKNCSKKYGAFYYDTLCESVTDIIIGKNITELSMKKLLDSKYSNRLVSIDWFIDSIQSLELCSQQNYLIYSYSQFNKMSSSSSSTSSTTTSTKFKKINIIEDFNIDIDELQKLNDEIINENSSSLSKKLSIDELNNDDDYGLDDDDNDIEFEYSLNELSTPMSFDNYHQSLSSLFNYKENTTRDESDEYESKVIKKLKTENPKIINNDYGNNEQSKSNIVIMFSAFDVGTKNFYTKLTTKHLKVDVNDNETLTENVTHLILYEPKRSEKVFSAIAAGIFILKYTFIIESLKWNKLLPEQDYQWGSDWQSIDDQTINKNDNENEDELNVNNLMRMAFQWKQFVDKNNGRKLFQDLKILILHNDLILRSCANVLRSGGAQIFFINDLIGRSNLSELIDEINYAIINTNWSEKPILPREKFMKIIDYCHENNLLTDCCVITRFIFQGPNYANLNQLRGRYKISNIDIRNAIAKFY